MTTAADPVAPAAVLAPPPGSVDTPRAGRLAHVPALDGIRGVAVLLVLAYHFGVPGFRGGFLGVDLFFVLSGFLITSLLLAERTATGRTSLVGFWLRRARRLLPAVFVLLAVVALSALAADPLARAALRGDLLSSIAYVTNWHFIVEGRSYFTETVGESPLRHLWSLAIEEQFYVLWPLLVGGAAWVVGRRAWGQRAVVGAWAAATAGSALLCAVLYDPVDPSRAYFGTDTRAHELLLGAGLAVLLARRTGALPSPRPAFSGLLAAGGLLGALVVAVCALTFSDSGALYYLGGSVLFSLAACGLIAGALGPVNPVVRGLSWRPLVWVGSVSYGTYLWHWPMAVWITEQSTGLSGVPLFSARVAATFAATVASAYLVERPIRRGVVRGRRLGPRIVFPAAAAIAAGLAALSLATTRDAVTAEELVAFDTEDWAVVAAPAADPTAPRVAIVGDSVARSLWPGLEGAAGRRDWGAWRAAYGSCEVGDLVNLDRDGREFATSALCAERVPVQQAVVVRDARPDVVLWYSGRDRYDVRVEDRVLAAGTPEWLDAKRGDWDRTLDRLTARGARVVLVLPVVPAGTEPECDEGRVQADGCGSSGYLTTSALRAAYADWAREHAGEVEVVDPMPIVCPGGLPCPERVDGVRLRFDGIHYTEDGAAWLAPRLIRASATLSALPRP